MAQQMMRLDGAIARSIEEKRKKIDTLASSRHLQDPLRPIEDKRMAVAVLSERLEGGMERVTERSRLSLAARSAQLGALDPFAVLTRGYSAVFAEGSSVRSVDQLAEGQRVTLRLSDGEAEADVIKTKRFGENNESKNEL